MKKIIAIVLPAVLIIPVVAVAQNFDYVTNWLDQGLVWLRLAITVVMILMTLYFLISVFQYISAKDAAKQAEQKKRVINGLIGLFIAVGVWGIIRIAGSVIGINTANPNGQTPVGITCPPGLIYKPNLGICDRV